VLLAFTHIAGHSGQVLALLAVAAFIAGLSRGFSGFGAALIFVPLASAMVGPTLAAPVLLVIDGFGALPMLPDAWRRAQHGPVFIMGLGTLAALPVGLMALKGLDPELLRWGISFTVMGLVALLASGWRYHGRPHRAVTVAVGGISGLLSGAAQIGGPPVVAYWLGSAGAAARDVRANIVMFFVWSTIYSVAVFGMGGLLSLRVAALSLAAGPAYLAGIMLGMRMFGLARPETFRRICYGLITLAAILGLPVFH
jgi:uncharacterized membrane protein YfcA